MSYVSRLDLALGVPGHARRGGPAGRPALHKGLAGRRGQGDAWPGQMRRVACAICDRRAVISRENDDGAAAAWSRNGDRATDMPGGEGDIAGRRLS